MTIKRIIISCAVVIVIGGWGCGREKKSETAVDDTIVSEVPSVMKDSTVLDNAESANADDDSIVVALSYTFVSDDNLSVSDDDLSSARVKRDTLVALSKDLGILFREYNKESKEWYRPHIVNINKNDTLKVTGFHSGDELVGSKLRYCAPSPNREFVVLDYNDWTNELRLDNYKIIDIKNANAVKTIFVLNEARIESGREYADDIIIIKIKNANAVKKTYEAEFKWDDKNNLIQAGSKILFDSEKYVLDEEKKTRERYRWDGAICKDYDGEGYAVRVEECIFPKASLRQVYDIVSLKEMITGLPATDTTGTQFTEQNGENVMTFEYKYKSPKHLYVFLDYMYFIEKVEIIESIGYTKSKYLYANTN